jgi:hypothetical protein
VWRDQAHFDEWAVGVAVFSASVRIASLKSSLLPIVLPAHVNQEKSSVVAVGFGMKENYSDVVIKYHMVFSQLW